MQLQAPFVLEYAYKRSTGPVIGRFLTALREGRVEGVRAADGTVYVPAREYAPNGDALGEDWVTVANQGQVLVAADGWAVVRLDGASTGLLHRALSPMSAGDRVHIHWSAERVGHITDIAGFHTEPGVAPKGGGGDPVYRFKQPTRLEYLVHAGPTTAKFLRHILEDRLVGQRCPDCAKVYVPPRGACPTCAVSLAEEVPLPDQGVVTTFSVIHIPFEGQRLKPPYACAHILLDGADVPLLHIVGGCDVADVHRGMRVRAVWDEDRSPTLGRVRFFEPVP